MANPLYDEPSEVTAEHGEVQVDGPDAVGTSLAPTSSIAEMIRALRKQTLHPEN